MTEAQVVSKEFAGKMPGERAEIFLGLDWGYAQDRTALAGFRRTQYYHWVGDMWGRKAVKTKQDVLHVFTLKPWPLRTEHDDIIDEINEQVARLKTELETSLGKAPRIVLAGDQTGVGAPIMRDFKAKKNPHDIGIKSVHLNNAAAERYDRDTDIWHVPRLTLLMTGVRGIEGTLSEGDREASVRFAKGLVDHEYARTLEKEMRNIDFRTYKTTGNPEAPAWRERTHDDLCFAYSLACWAANKPPPGEFRIYRRGHPVTRYLHRGLGFGR